MIAKLAALIPRPHKNLVLFGEPMTDPLQHKRRQWADLMRRAFGYDLLSCPNCGGKMLLLASILEHNAIRKILTHLGLPHDPPAAAPACAQKPVLLAGEQIRDGLSVLSAELKVEQLHAVQPNAIGRL